MGELLDPLLADIRKRIKAKDPTAVARAAQLSERYPNEREVWYVLADAHDVNDDMHGAVAAMNRLADTAPPEPAMFYFRGFYWHRLGNLHAALADYDQGIALSKQIHYEYYLEVLYFLRADVLVKLGRKAEARADLAHVRDDYVEWMPKRRSKADILADCEG